MKQTNLPHRTLRTRTVVDESLAPMPSHGNAMAAFTVLFDSGNDFMTAEAIRTGINKTHKEDTDKMKRVAMDRLTYYMVYHGYAVTSDEGKKRAYKIASRTIFNVRQAAIRHNREFKRGDQSEQRYGMELKHITPPRITLLPVYALLAGLIIGAGITTIFFNNFAY